MDNELLQRTKRIETRIVGIAQALGIETGKKPTFDPTEQRVILPSIHTTIKEVLDSIPETWNGEVGVYVGDRLVATLDKSGNRH